MTDDFVVGDADGGCARGESMSMALMTQVDGLLSVVTRK